MSDDKRTETTRVDVDAETIAAECHNKLAEWLADNGMDGFVETIVRKYTGGESLRDLERTINDEIARQALLDLRAAFPSVGQSITADELIAAVRSDDPTPQQRTIREYLNSESTGTSTEAVASQLVSYQTVRRFLNNCVDVDTSKKNNITQSDGIETIGWATGRAESVVETTIDRLEKNDVVSTGDIDVAVRTVIECQECGGVYTPSEFVRGGGCECGTDSDGD